LSVTPQTKGNDMAERNKWLNEDVPNICGNCIHFVQRDETFGQCRRYPPVLDGEDSYQQPWVRYNVICGEHKRKENDAT
jgi:hypothetical protein